MAASSFLVDLHSQGFGVHLSVPFEANQSGFYSLLAAAFGLHRAKDYGELSSYLEQLWSQRFPTWWRGEDRGDLEGLGKALRKDLWEGFRREPWANLILSGQTPDKANEQMWTSIMDFCSVQLTWVEMTSSGRSVRTYAPAKPETWRLFVTMAEELPFLYLLVHRDFEGPPKSGYPFYSSLLERKDIEPVPPVQSQSCEGAVHIQAEIINLLLGIFSHLNSLPADSKPLQDHVNTLYRRIQPLSSSINPTSLQAFLHLTETKPPVPLSPRLSPNACVSCGTIWSPGTLWRAEHGCALCMKCCFQQKDRPACLCTKPLSTRDQATLKMFVNITVDKF